MASVIKIKYENTIRRLAFQSKPRGDDLSYSRLEARIRELFKIPVEAKIHLTYADEDKDFVTMADDQDLLDAIIIQELNPLRLYVTLADAKSGEVAAPVVEQQSASKVEPSDVPFKQILKGLSPESVKDVLTSCEPLLKGVAASPRQLSDLVEVIFKTLTPQISSAVKVPEGSSAEVAGCTSVSGSAPADAVTSNTSIPPVPCEPPVLTTEATDAENASRAFHNGVQCDSCGMTPIVGPRFKSTKKHDYDLCVSCFKEVGIVGDYTRIDRPLYRPRHLHPPGTGRMWCPAFNPNYHAGRPLSVRGPYGGRPDRCHQMNNGAYGGKLDARFVQDVTIGDGTELAPGTHFTKIWRLRNSGTLPWPPQTKLVHVGGDELGFCVVPLELPEQGLAPDEEIEASVDLIAPEKPGRYVSHWRLASPSGPKFGHRVWVLIQVVLKENIITSEGKISVSNQDMSGGVPSIGSRPSVSSSSLISRKAFVKASHDVLVSDEETKVSHQSSGILKSFVDLQEPFSGLSIADAVEVPLEALSEQPEIRSPTVEIAENIANVQEVSRGSNIADAGMGQETNQKTAEKKEEVLLEKIVRDEAVAVENCELGGGFSMVEMPSNTGSQVNSAPTTPKVSVSLPVVNPTNEDEARLDDSTSTPEVLCAKLEVMGFTDRTLNLELLLRNKLDLRRTLDDLFAAAEWDPILEELEEMGFYDTQMNRRLMFKNNGSVKRVVKELVQMYKDPSGKGKQMVNH